jgi:hypothetical protein
MKNRAKCKLCGDILESFHRYDYMSCKCGEISIDGGLDALHCYAKDFSNFIRIDDEGNEILVKVLEKPEQDIPIESAKLTRQEKINMFKEMVKNIENLPQGAMEMPVNHYDLYSFMVLIGEIL